MKRCARARRSARGHALHLEAELDIAAHGLPREQRVGLEHHAAARLDPGDRLAAQQHLAAGRLDEAGEQVEHRRLAAAGRAEQADELAFGDVERKSWTATRSGPRAGGRHAGHMIGGQDGRHQAPPMPFPGQQQRAPAASSSQSATSTVIEMHSMPTSTSGRLPQSLRLPDQRAEAVLRGDHLGRQHAGPGDRQRHLQAGDDAGQRAGQDHLAHHREIAGAEIACRAHQQRIDAARALDRCRAGCRSTSP